MDRIDEFVTRFDTNRVLYRRVKKQLDRYIEANLQGFKYLWESRVKTVDSLRTKLRKLEARDQDQDARKKRKNDQSDQSKHPIDYIHDLVGGRLVLVRWKDFKLAEDSIIRLFDV